METFQLLVLNIVILAQIVRGGFRLNVRVCLIENAQETNRCVICSPCSNDYEVGLLRSVCTPGYVDCDWLCTFHQYWPHRVSQLLARMKGSSCHYFVTNEVNTSDTTQFVTTILPVSKTTVLDVKDDESRQNGASTTASHETSPPKNITVAANTIYFNDRIIEFVTFGAISFICVGVFVTILLMAFLNVRLRERKKIEM